MKTTQDKVTAAWEAVRQAEEKGMSKSTLDRRYKAAFAAEGAAKAAGVWA